MADRDLDAFGRHVADDAIFFAGETTLRGRARIVEAWRQFFAEPEAPFSWVPETVEVLNSGCLPFSSGPVFAPDGRRTATFNSIWRLDPDGVWRVIFDKGETFCRCSNRY